MGVWARKIPIMIVLACAAMLAACSSSAHVVRGITPVPTVHTSSSPSTPRLDTSPASEQKIGRPYTINGITYVPARDDDYDEVGIASWYGPNFHGRPTANGEVFDQNELSAAHPTLPIPAMIEVTNLENRRMLVLRLNDRGPFARNRMLDVSRAAAIELGFLEQGTTQVRVRYLGPPDGTAPARTSSPVHVASNTRSSGRYRVQVGAFSERANAEALRRRLSSEGEVSVERARSRGRNVYRVFLGDDLARGQADQLSRSLSRYGVYDARVVALN